MTAPLSWKLEVQNSLKKSGIDSCLHYDSNYSFLIVKDSSLTIQLVDIRNPFSPQQLIELFAEMRIQNNKAIHLWEDVWARNPGKVIDRIRSFCGLDNRLHARKTALQRITKPVAKTFLMENHMQGFASSRFKYALILENEPVAVATFSSLRRMNFEDDYTSVELIRFATKRKYSVAGALSKLIIGFARLHHPNDIMTYVDSDWGNGFAFERMGFKSVGKAEPMFFSLDDENERSIILDRSVDPSGKVFNTGSLKMIFKVKDD